MKKALFRLETYYAHKATDVEKSVLRYILDNPRKVCDMDIHSLAKEGYCSAATIVRICKKNDFKGFKELKLALMKDLKFNDELVESTFDKRETNDMKKLVQEILNDNIRSINNTYSLLDFGELTKMVELIDKARVIRLFGIGASFLVVKDLQQKLERVGKVSILHEDTHMALINSANIKADELAIVVSYSGKTSEILEMAQNIKKRGAKIIAITKYDNNKLMQMADYNLYVPVIEAPLRIGACSSRISQLCAVDTLFHTYVTLVKTDSMDNIISTKEMLPKEE